MNNREKGSNLESDAKIKIDVSRNVAVFAGAVFLLLGRLEKPIINPLSLAVSRCRGAVSCHF